MLRRNAEPDLELMEALMDTASESFACRACGHVGLIVTDRDPLDDEDWGNAKEPSRKCELCSAVIPSERIEIFPDTKLCVACQGSDERGETTQVEVEYCPRCGDIMQLKQVARGYRMSCPSCRR